MSNPQVELHIADHGVITIELDADKAPKSTENFLAYVNKGHYNNTIFHRIIDGFMIQGGGFEPGMKQKDTDAPIENEAKLCRVRQGDQGHRDRGQAARREDRPQRFPPGRAQG
jgi:cyclophilin family peptidyl-prolyl cis-trans isomerase